MPRSLDAVLTEVPIFHGLTDAQLELISGCAKDVRFGEGAQLFRRGSAADTFYVVRHGSVALDTFVPGRGTVTIETIDAGEVLGWSWLFKPYRWHLDGHALTIVGAIEFDGAYLRGKCDEDPVLGYALMERFAQVAIERLQWTRLRLLDHYGNANGN